MQKTTPKKKILLWETLSTISGGQKMTLLVLDLLAEQYQFHCLIPQQGLLAEELTKRHIPYTLLGNQSLPIGVKGKGAILRYGWMSIKHIIRSLQIIRRYKPDLLYCPGPAALPWSALCASLTHTPVVWHLHHMFLDRRTVKLLNACAAWQSVQKIIAVSHCVGKQITHTKAQSKIHILYNPIDMQKYANGNKVTIQAEIEKKLGHPLSCKTLVLGEVALIQPSKRQDFVLQIFKILQEQGRDIMGLFAGEVLDEAFFEQLKQQSIKLGLQKQILFLGRRNDIPNLLKLIHVLIVPSVVEGFTLAGQEAAAAGVPVATCNVGGAEEFIRISQAGESFVQDNAQDAARVIETILKNKENMIQNGRLFTEQHSIEAYQRDLKKIFEGVCK